MSVPVNEKALEAIHAADTFSNADSYSDSDEAVIEHLNHTGEEVGLTWRSILAAVVSDL
jgi:hypothetical protein